MTPKIDAPICLPPADLQSMAEAVFLAIRLLEDARRKTETALGDEDTATYLFFRVEAVRDALSPAMSHLAEYMPKPIGASGAGLQPRKCEGCGSPDVPGDALNLFCHDCIEAADQAEIEENADSALMDDRAKLWPGGYDNL